MNRRFRVGLALAAGCLLTAPCLADWRAEGESLVYAPALGSTLVSRPDLPFKLARVERGASRTMVLAYQAAGSKPVPVAAISSSAPEPDAPVSVHLRWSADEPSDPPALKVAAFEYLYALALRQEPEARFCLAYGAQRCEAANGGSSHAELLRELVRARERAVERASPSSAVAWHVVAMAPASIDGDQVSVRITSDRAPMVGATVIFNRAPHSGCVAKSGENGLARCVLVDQHGDDESHADHDKTRVVATFPGDVRGGRVLVPTTFVLPPAP
ncbi:MAG: hypothetical protein ABIN08_20040 [Caldimonas sp.]